jgi:hypothetical protein
MTAMNAPTRSLDRATCTLLRLVAGGDILANGRLRTDRVAR